MSTLSEHHLPKAGIVGKCSVPMWIGGYPAGFCDAPAYGEQYRDPFLPPCWAYNRNNKPPFASGLCCESHGGPSKTATRFVRDGNMWCSFRPDFVNLQESIAGFGPTQATAYDDMAALISESIRAPKSLGT